jgi:hypothetical protein
MKASYPDGWRKQNHNDWQIMRTHQKLKLEQIKRRRNKKYFDSSTKEDLNNLGKEMAEVKKKFKPKNDDGGDLNN